ncbi:winged helix-turn-helix domain-containing protein [Gordonia pseudamarae]|uniref:winged helix-turn-helix domain-containing protein n=1 Tax=Gordonia pseudamarae TaxID=2831662 RepID=UPI0038992B75
MAGGVGDPVTGDSLSAPQARRIALAAQGFVDKRPVSVPTMTHLKRVLGRTRLIQMDSVNVVVRAHYLPMFARLGPYDRRLLARAAWQPIGKRRFLAEYWAHEAALIPVDDWPLFGWRMDEFAGGRWKYTREVMARNTRLADDVVAVIDELGPSMPRTIESALGIVRGRGKTGSWWERGEVKHVCEALFAAGRLSAVRDENFSRFYDRSERVVGPGVAGERIARDDAQRLLVARAAAALGVGTVTDIADYYRMTRTDTQRALDEAVDEGTITQVSVDGWDAPAYLAAGVRTPRSVTMSAILSPFDPLVFFRPRALRLFDFHYRIEIYTPAHKRVHGYYVHPYLLGDDIVARVDLKADRAASVLRVPAAHLEPGRPGAVVAERLAADLTTMAHWLGLDAVRVGPAGDLAARLSRAVGRRPPSRPVR